MNNEDYSVLNCKLDNNLSIRVPGKQVLFIFLPIFTDGWPFFVGFTVCWVQWVQSLLLNGLLSLLITESAELLISEFINFWVF